MQVKNMIVYVVIFMVAAVSVAMIFSAPVTVHSTHIIPAGHGAENQMYSTNWGGWVVASNQLAVSNPDTAPYETLPQNVVTEASASWVQQQVTGSGFTYSSQWVGIGGYFANDSTLIQTGTSADTSGGTVKYSAWYELLPNYETTIKGVSISPGDLINASVVCIANCTSSNQTWKISLADLSNGESFNTTVNYASKMLSAEWIEERPGLCNGPSCSLSTLANYGTAYYGQDYSNIINTNYANIGTGLQPFASLPHSNVTMIEGSVYSIPSAPSADMSSFYMTYTNETSTTSTTTITSTTATTTASTTVTTTICANYNPHGKCIG